MAQAAARRAPVTDGGMAHLRHGSGDEWTIPLHAWPKFQFALTSHGAAHQRVSLFLQVGQLGATVQIDQYTWLSHAHIDQRHQTLTPSKRPRV